jgi:penicillin-insensitive murein endopeptidase
MSNRESTTCRAGHFAVRQVAVTLCAFSVIASGVARAQDKGTLGPQPLPPLAKPATPATPAKELFARKTTPATLSARSIGFYSKGCLAGAVALPINGETWQ